jgi:hypothetical protein
MNKYSRLYLEEMEKNGFLPQAASAFMKSLFQGAKHLPKAMGSQFSATQGSLGNKLMSLLKTYGWTLPKKSITDAAGAAKAIYKNPSIPIDTKSVATRAGTAAAEMLPVGAAGAGVLGAGAAGIDALTPEPPPPPKSFIDRLFS